jgi:hypothetical protein
MYVVYGVYVRLERNGRLQFACNIAKVYWSCHFVGVWCVNIEARTQLQLIDRLELAMVDRA